MPAAGTGTGLFHIYGDPITSAYAMLRHVPCGWDMVRRDVIALLSRTNKIVESSDVSLTRQKAHPTTWAVWRWTCDQLNFGRMLSKFTSGLGICVMPQHQRS